MSDAEYMRRRRLQGGDQLRSHEAAVKKAYRATPDGRRSRTDEYRVRQSSSAGTALAGNGTFVGVDGEGGNDPAGRHDYYLLRAGEEWLETGTPLHWSECFDFLADLDPRNIYVAYFFDYDVTMMCRSMPVPKIVRLLDRAARQRPGYNTPLPLDIGDFEIDYLPGKFFKVRRATAPGVTNLPWVEISDVGTFFQSKFVTAVKKWNVVSPEELAMLVAGKEARMSFGKMTEEIRIYNGLEIDVLERLMNKFRATCRSIGVSPRKWQGPGEMASAFMQMHQIPRKENLPYWENNKFKVAVDATYYGGRFETGSVGRIAGPVYAADINSAYPFALTHVPCLVHGHWKHTKFRPKGDTYFAVGSAVPNSGAAYYGLPFRARDGGVSFPAEIGVGSYWSFEIKAAIHQDFEVADSWSYLRKCDCTPFDWIPDLYQKRLALKKDTQGIALKLGLNSLYGKTAQRIGAAPYNNLVWGSYITAYTRAQLQRFIHSLPSCSAGGCGGPVHMLATDGIFTSELPDGFSANDSLGDWDLKTYPDGIFIVQPGLYYDNSGQLSEEDRLTKTRGVPLNLALKYESEIRDEFSRLWDSQNPAEHSVSVPLTSFIGLRAGLHRKNPDLMGQWPTSPRKIGFNWTGKREWESTRMDGYLRTYPRAGSLLEVSRSYDVDLANVLDSERYTQIGYGEGPDWAPYLANPTEE